MAVLICAAGDKSTQGILEMREYSNEERVKRGFKAAGVLWIAALVGFLVPLLHFVLLGGFFLAGIVFGTATYLDKKEVVRGEFTCPICGEPNHLPHESMDFPRGVRCQKCHYDLELKTAQG